jgi:hypothetical protein
MKATIILSGKVIDVGNIDCGRGFSAQVEGEDVAVTGLTEEETKNIGRFLGQSVTITIVAGEQETKP